MTGPAGRTDLHDDSSTSARVGRSYELAAIGALLYLAAFDYMPKSVSAACAIALLGFMGVVAIREVLRASGSMPLMAILLVTSVSTLSALGLLLGVSSFSPIGGLRMWLPFVVALGLLASPPTGRSRGVEWAASGVIAFGATTALLAGPVVIGQIPRAKPFTGGDGTTAHPSAYAVLLCLGILWFKPRARGHVRSRPNAFFLAVGVLLLGAYVVATALLAFSVFILARAVASPTLRERIGGVRYLLVLIPLAVVLWHEQITTHSKLEVASGRAGNGRVDAWMFRYHLLKERSTAGLFLGSGPNTDRFRTNLWWWDEKDSHSDVIRIAVEYGLVGVALALLWVWVIYRISSGAARAVVIASTAAAFVSNAFWERPIHAVLLWYVVALAMTADDRAPKRRAEKQGARSHVPGSGPEARSIPRAQGSPHRMRAGLGRRGGVELFDLGDQVINTKSRFHPLSTSGSHGSTELGIVEELGQA